MQYQTNEMISHNATHLKYLVTYGGSNEQWFAESVDVDNFIDAQPNNGYMYLKYFRGFAGLKYLGSVTKASR